MDIHKLREGIDTIDDEIVQLFLRRMDICKNVGKYKEENGLPIFDAAREAELLAKKTDGLGGEDKENVKRLFLRIMEISKDVQSKQIKQSAVGFCGIKGANGYSAAKMISNETVAFESFNAVALAAQRGEIEKGVLPIENTTSGSVSEVYDILADSGLFIVGEVVVPVRHCLLGTGSIEDVKTVCSHPQAFAQCSEFLEKYSLIQSSNTAIAARECAKNADASVGVIAPYDCAKLYGLNVLKEGIENVSGNKTRFVIVSAKRFDGGGDKASVVFTLPHRQGALADMLYEFKNVNMTMILSRPLGNFEYRFYVDFEADEPLKVLDEITKEYNTVRVLGVYKKDGN